MKIDIHPYIPIEDQNFNEEAVIKITPDLFNNVELIKNRLTFSFNYCRFKKLVIENKEDIDFEKIDINFYCCFIEYLEIKHVATKNISLSFGCSVLEGRIANNNLSASFNNCILNSSIFLIGLKKVSIRYEDGNIFPRRFKRLSNNLDRIIGFLQNDQRYQVYDTSEIIYHVGEESKDKIGFIFDKNSNDDMWKIQRALTP